MRFVHTGASSLLVYALLSTTFFPVLISEWLVIVDQIPLNTGLFAV
jgi:hypothetical protein